MRENLGGISLHEIGSAIEKHFEENPTHGYNCVCMDRYLVALRTQLSNSFPENKKGVQAFEYVVKNSIERAAEAAWLMLRNW